MKTRDRIDIKEALKDPERREFLLKLACSKPEGHNWQDDPHRICTPSELSHRWFVVGLIVAVELIIMLLILFTIFSGDPT